MFHIYNLLLCVCVCVADSLIDQVGWLTLPVPKVDHLGHDQPVKSRSGYNFISAGKRGSYAQILDPPLVPIRWPRRASGKTCGPSP